MAFEIVQADLVQAKARVLLKGPAGSGKTYSALTLARMLGDSVALIDTERKSAAKYARRWPGFRWFHVAFEPPYTPLRYVEAIKFCEAEGKEVIIIDSLSHAWAGEGGALEMVDNAKQRFGGNSYYGWRDVTPQHNRLIDAMLSSNAHIIGCVRSKTEYAEEKQGSRTAYRKVGTSAIQREGMDYEFDIEFTLDIDHRAVVTKSRFPDIADAVFDLIDPTIGKKIKDWVDQGSPEPPAPEAVMEETPDIVPHTQEGLIQFAKDTFGLGIADVQAALKGHGISKFEVKNWDLMLDAVAQYAEAQRESVAA